MLIGSSTTRAGRIRSCSTIPAPSRASTKTRLEPSQPGHSPASISTTALSIWRPASAAMTCSIISTLGVAAGGWSCVAGTGTTESSRRRDRRPAGQVGPLEDDPGVGLGRMEADRDVRAVEESDPAHLRRAGERTLPTGGSEHSLPLRLILERPRAAGARSADGRRRPSTTAPTPDLDAARRPRRVNSALPDRSAISRIVADRSGSSLATFRSSRQRRAEINSRPAVHRRRPHPCRTAARGLRLAAGFGLAVAAYIWLR